MHDKGYVKLWRAFKNDEFWTKKREYSQAEAWIDILMECNYCDGVMLHGNKAITVNRGQCAYSLGTWMKRWDWKSRHKVHLFLKLLEALNKVVTENLTVTVRITVCNYSKYNDKGNESGTPGERSGNDQGTDGETIEEVKKKRKKEVKVFNATIKWERKLKIPQTDLNTYIDNIYWWFNNASADYWAGFDTARSIDAEKKKMLEWFCNKAREEKAGKKVHRSKDIGRFITNWMNK